MILKLYLFSCGNVLMFTTKYLDVLQMTTVVCVVAEGGISEHLLLLLLLLVIMMMLLGLLCHPGLWLGYISNSKGRLNVDDLGGSW